ncbi:TPA: hypothetical protein ACFP4Q_000339 [Neisseria weaveri]
MAKFKLEFGKCWDGIWLFIIIILCVSPLLFFFFVLKDKQNYSIDYSNSDVFSKSYYFYCKEDKECQIIQRQIKDSVEEINKKVNINIEQIQLRIDNQERIINTLTFSVSMYAILITVISIFFSLRESQRIDKGLDDFKLLQEQIINGYQEADKSVEEKLEKSVEKAKSDMKSDILNELSSKDIGFSQQKNNESLSTDSNIQSNQQVQNDLSSDDIDSDNDVIGNDHYFIKK